VYNGEILLGELLGMSQARMWAEKRIILSSSSLFFFTTQQVDWSSSHLFMLGRCQVQISADIRWLYSSSSIALIGPNP